MLSIKQNILPFFESMLPSNTKEGGTLNLRTTFPTKTDPKGVEKVRTTILQLSELFLKATQEATEGIINARYKEFDALIRNFGCHMTALAVQEKVRNPQLLAEAKEINQLANEKLKALEKIPQPSKEDLGTNMITYLGKAGLDFKISSEMADLIRFRLLCIVNYNVVTEDGREIPETKHELIFKKISAPDNEVDIKNLGLLILGIQVEEAAKAVLFIRDVASKLNEKETLRAKLIQRMLNTNPRRNMCGITSLPLLYNTEAVIASIRGFVLVKNKLFLGEDPIADAKPMKVFLKMPGERILTDKEVQKLPPNEPIIVFEVFNKKGTLLAESIKEKGLINIINALNADLDQYAKGSDQKIKDKEALNDINAFKGCTNDTKSIFDLDHIYCASVKEEEALEKEALEDNNNLKKCTNDVKSIFDLDHIYCASVGEER